MTKWLSIKEDDVYKILEELHIELQYLPSVYHFLIKFLEDLRAIFS